MSHVNAIWKPAAAATPFTAHRVTIGNLLNKSKFLVYYEKILMGSLEDLSYFKSCPAEKTGPSPLSTKIYIQKTLLWAGLIEF